MRRSAPTTSNTCQPRREADPDHEHRIQSRHTPARRPDHARLAFHSWPMSVQDGIDVYTSFGFSPHPQEPQLFTSDTSPDEADSFFTSEGDQIDSVRTHLSNVVPKEERPAFRSQVRAAYAGFVAAFTGVLGRPRSVKDRRGRFSSQWFLDNGVGVWVGGNDGLIALSFESPEMAGIHQDDLRRGIADYSPANDPLLEG